MTFGLLINSIYGETWLNVKSFNWFSKPSSILTDFDRNPFLMEQGINLEWQVTVAIGLNITYDRNIWAFFTNF
jgi:hypothetical protein